MKELKNYYGSFIFLTGFFLSGLSFAQTNLEARANLTASCVISVPTVAYGNMDTVSANPNPQYSTHYDKSFTLQVKCTKDMPYQLNDTQMHGWKPTTGQATGPSTGLLYVLHSFIGNQHSGRIEVFGTLAQGPAYTVEGVGTGQWEGHDMLVTLKTQGYFPAPDFYSASTTLALTF